MLWIFANYTPAYLELFDDFPKIMSMYRMIFIKLIGSLTATVPD